MAWVRARFVNYKKGCTRLAAQVIKFTHGRWFSPDTPASSTTKTGRHDIVESGIKHQKSSNQSINLNLFFTNCVKTFFLPEKIHILNVIFYAIVFRILDKHTRKSVIWKQKDKNWPSRCKQCNVYFFCLCT